MRRQRIIISVLAMIAGSATASGQTARGLATFSGVVMSDSTHAPIAGADVSLPDLGKTTVADAQGSFRIDSIPPGDHQVRVRAIGYGAADTALAFKENETVRRRVLLGRAVTLEPMSVEATRPLLPSFEENRKLGLGHFLTRADLAAREDMSLLSFLEQMNGMRVIHGNGGHAWVMSTHSAGSVNPVPPQIEDSMQGAPRSRCWSKVYLNDLLVFSGRLLEERGRSGGLSARWEPLFDVSPFSAYQVEAIEYYAGAAETPLKYQRSDPSCGVLVIWTRRSQ